MTVDNFSYHVKQLVLFLPQTYIWRSNISNLSVLMKVIPETLHVHYIRYLPLNTQEEIEETKGVIKIRKSKE